MFMSKWYVKSSRNHILQKNLGQQDTVLSVIESEYNEHFYAAT